MPIPVVEWLSLSGIPGSDAGGRKLWQKYEYPSVEWSSPAIDIGVCGRVFSKKKACLAGLWRQNGPHQASARRTCLMLCQPAVWR
jgi:hypothetical protein